MNKENKLKCVAEGDDSKKVHSDVVKVKLSKREKKKLRLEKEFAENNKEVVVAKADLRLTQEYEKMIEKELQLEKDVEKVVEKELMPLKNEYRELNKSANRMKKLINRKPKSTKFDKSGKFENEDTKAPFYY